MLSPSGGTADHPLCAQREVAGRRDAREFRGNGIWFGWSFRDLEGVAFKDWEKRGLGKGMWMGLWEGAQGVKIFFITH